MYETNTNALNILTLHGVIASPKGAAISFFMGLLRRSAPRNDKLLIAFVLVHFTKAIIGPTKGRLRIDSSQFSGLSHSSNPEHQSGCSHIHFISLRDVEHLRKTFPHNSSQTIRDFFFAPE